MLDIFVSQQQTLLDWAFSTTMENSNCPAGSTGGMCEEVLRQALPKGRRKLMAEVLNTTTLAGQMTPWFQKLVLDEKERQTVWNGINQVLRVSDVGILLLLGWGLTPVCQLIYDLLIPFKQQPDFKSTKAYHIINTVSQVFQLGMLVYLFDMFKIFLLGAGFHIPRGERLTHAFAYIVYIVWATTRLSLLKQYVLFKITRECQGRLQIFNRLMDAVLFLCSLCLIIDILNLEMGYAMSGVVAFGSVGTLVFSLASKDIASHWMYGILLSASDRIYEGDMVRLAKTGFSGKVRNFC